MRIPKRSFGALCLLVLAAGVAPAAWGQSFDDLVLHTITPCRLWDTRMTSPIAANTVRSFNVFSSNLSSQGGNSSGCGVPASTPATTIAVVVNFAATNSTGNGTLKGWAGDISEPTFASIVNYSPATFAIANAAIVAVRTTGTLGGGSDVSLRANGAQTDAVGDIIGYFTKSERHVTVNATSPALFAGSASNSVAANVAGATISGGGDSGGANTVTSNFGTVGGGRNNNAGGNNSNTEGLWSTVGGGENYGTAANHATVGGGVNNLAVGDSATIGGGSGNHAGSNFSTIPGGSSNTIDPAAPNAFAAGSQANVTHTGAMLFSDTSTPQFSSKNNNEFAVRATGGVRMVTAINPSTGATTAGCSVDASGNLFCTGSFITVSDRTAKTNFTPVDVDQVLKQLAAMPIQRWTYRTDSKTRHIGPMAQDFYSAFEVGQDDKHIATVDADGVALAAIQALYKQLQQTDAEIQELRARLNGMQSVVDRVERLERQLPVRNVALDEPRH